MKTRPLIYRVLDAIAGDDRLGPIDISVLVYLTKFADRDGGGCFVSNETLAVTIGVGERAIRRSILRLVELGMVTRRRRKYCSSVTTIIIGAETQAGDSRTDTTDRSKDSRVDTGVRSKNPERTLVSARTDAGVRENGPERPPTVLITDLSTDPDIHTTTPSRPVDVEWVFTEWNEIASQAGLVKVAKQTKPRIGLARARLKEHGEDSMHTVIGAPLESPFLRGELGERNWQASFDWIMKAGNFVKVLEGNYKDRKPTGTVHQKTHVADLEAFRRATRGGAA